MSIVKLKHGFADHSEPDTIQSMVDINMPRGKSNDAKKAFNRLADFATGTESAAQLQVLKSIEGLDLSKLDGGKQTSEPTLEEKGAQLVARFATVDSDARNKLTKLFFDLVKAEPAVLTVNDRNVVPVEIADLSAIDEVAIAACFVVDFMLS